LSERAGDTPRAGFSVCDCDRYAEHLADIGVRRRKVLAREDVRNEFGVLLLARGEPLGIWLDSSEHPEAEADALAHVQLVAINFPVFSDGRGYSYARLLREKFGFAGELRAIGDVLRDQLFLLRRCGFDSFEIRADRDPADALASLGDFRHVYQSATVDTDAPLLLRAAPARAGA